MLTVIDCHGGCAFCKRLAGLDSGWVRCQKDEALTLIPTAHLEGRDQTLESRGLVWVRESIVDLYADQTCFEED